LNQLNQLLHKIINCFKAFKSPIGLLTNCRTISHNSLRTTATIEQSHAGSGVNENYAASENLGS